MGKSVPKWQSHNRELRAYLDTPNTSWAVYGGQGPTAAPVHPAPVCSQCSRAHCHPLSLQTYGSKNLLRVGVILQRATLILLLCCFPCCAILINIEQLLLLIRQDPDVSRSGGPVPSASLPHRSPAQWGCGRVATVIAPR